MILTLPAAAIVGAVAAGTAVVVAVVALAIAIGAHAASRRRRVTAENVNDDAVATPAALSSTAA